MTFNLRTTTVADFSAIRDLYRAVSRTPGGILRTTPEITDAYVANTLLPALDRGVALVAHDAAGQIFGSIHAHTPPVLAFRHLLSDLTIMVHPEAQGRGVGRALFTQFFRRVETMTHILRVELYVREHNTRNVQFYERLGFVREGRHPDKILNADGSTETPLFMGWRNPNFAAVDRRMHG